MHMCGDSQEARQRHFVLSSGELVETRATVDTRALGRVVTKEPILLTILTSSFFGLSLSDSLSRLLIQSSAGETAVFNLYYLFFPF